MQKQKHRFVYVYEVITKCFQIFFTCLYFSIALIRGTSNHCHLMELFTSKESFKEKVDSNNSWKTAWPRMILEWHLLLRLSLGFVWKTMSSFKREEGEREREREKERERHTQRDKETERQRDREREEREREGGRQRGAKHNPNKNKHHF